MVSEDTVENKIAEEDAALEKAASEAVDIEGEEDDEGDDSPVASRDSLRRSNVATLKGKIDILVDKPLPHLNHGAAKAYAARGKDDGSDNFYALICESHFVPRSAIAEKFSNMLSTGIVRLASYGVVFWPPADGERYVFVYENTMGKSLMKSLKEGGLDWKADKAMSAFIKPMISTLLDLRDADLVHGCINPMNIYDGNNPTVEKVVLGECLSAPPSFNQPTVFEPIERAMATPIARGKGTNADDLYSFGVSLTMILRSKDPLAGMTDNEIIRQKIELGSYGALTGKDRFTGSILELLRGLLYDDWRQRWTLDEVMSWMDGQRLSPKQSSKKQKASRPMHFNDKRYYRPVLLAMDLNNSDAEAAQMIDGGHLEQWVDRSLEDNLTKGRLEEALDAAREQGRGPGYWDRLLCRVSMALDPDAPIRFKGWSFQPDGVPYALAETMAFKRDIVPFIELINQQLVLTWIGQHTDPNVDVGGLINKYDSCRAFLRQATLGYGIERCLYYICHECPCQSEILEGYYVRTPESYMYALESIASNPNKPNLFIDRHIAAFLSVKDKRNIDPYFIELNSGEYHKKVLGNVKVLATIQKRSRMEKLPRLAQWAAETLDPVYERLHDREMRVKMKDKIDKLAKTGDIVKIVTVLDHNETWQKDFIAFRKAMDEFSDLSQENIELEHKMKKPDTFGRDTGREVAAIVAGLLSGVIILAFAFMHFTQIDIF